MRVMGVPLSDLINPTLEAKLRAAVGQAPRPDPAPAPEHKSGLEVSTPAAPADLEHKSQAPGAVQVLETDDDTGRVVALVSVTGVEDKVKDVIEPGAYTKTLAKHEPIGVWSHDDKVWVARTEKAEELFPGHELFRELKTMDGQPWPAAAGAVRVEALFNLETQHGRDAYSDVKFFKGKTGWSIGYRATKAHRNPRTGVRSIKELDWFEYSPVMVGAASQPMTLSVKSLSGAHSVDPDSDAGLVDAAVLATLEPSELTRHAELKAAFGGGSALETKARVRTAEGARRYGQPIGSVIIPDVLSGTGPLSDADLNIMKAAARKDGDTEGLAQIEAAGKLPEAERRDALTSGKLIPTGAKPKIGGDGADTARMLRDAVGGDKAAALGVIKARMQAGGKKEPTDAEVQAEATKLANDSSTMAPLDKVARVAAGDGGSKPSDGSTASGSGGDGDGDRAALERMVAKTEERIAELQKLPSAGASRGGVPDQIRDNRRKLAGLKQRLGAMSRAERDPESGPAATRPGRLAERAAASRRNAEADGVREPNSTPAAKPAGKPVSSRTPKAISDRWGPRDNGRAAGINAGQRVTFDDEDGDEITGEVDKVTYDRDNGLVTIEVAGRKYDLPEDDRVTTRDPKKPSSGGSAPAKPRGEFGAKLDGLSEAQLRALRNDRSSSQQLRDAITAKLAQMRSGKTLFEDAKLAHINLRLRAAGDTEVEALPLSVKGIDVTGIDDYYLAALIDADPTVELKGSSASLNRSPRSNWVEKAGELPAYVREVARSIEKTGKDLSSAIPIAIGRIKKWARGGDGVKPDTVAKAQKALAEWEALKARSGKKYDSELLEHLESKALALIEQVDAAYAFLYEVGEFKDLDAADALEADVVEPAGSELADFDADLAAVDLAEPLGDSKTLLSADELARGLELKALLRP